MHLKPGLMKGPNAQLEFVDFLEQRLKMKKWNNIPLPLVDAFKVLVEAFEQVKQCYFTNFNSIVNTQRVVNMNQQQARTDDLQIRREALENQELSDQNRDKKLAEQFEQVKKVISEA